jgi:hypothetical protein
MPVNTQTGSYTVDATDYGKVINITSGTFTLALTAAATLGTGFFFGFDNSGSGVVTIDPNSSETIDGGTTLVVNTGDKGLVFCNGSNFFTVAYSIKAGTAANQLVRLDSSAKLPAVDGSQLTNLPSSGAAAIDLSLMFFDIYENLGSVSAKTRLGTPFNAVSSAPLVGAQFVIHKEAGTIAAGKSVWMTLEADSSGSPSGTALATSDTVDATTYTSAIVVTKFTFSTPYTMVAGTKYWLVLRFDYTIDGSNYLAVHGPSSAVSAVGAAKKFDGGSTWVATGNPASLAFSTMV